MEDAKAQALQLANDADLTLGDIYNVSFSTGGPSLFAQYGVGGGGGGDVYAQASTTIIPGQISVSASVFLSYNIR